MSLSWTRRLVGLAVAFVALITAVPLFAQTGGVTGKCTGQEGKPLAGYTIALERTEVRWTSHTKTNKKGEYIYIGLAPGEYKLTLEDPSGKQMYTITRHVGIGDPTEINFDMAKEMEYAKKQMEANPEYQKKMAEQAKDQKEFTGLKQIFDEGTRLYDAQQYAEAAAMYEKALPMAKEKNVPIVLSRLADSYREAKEYNKALETYQKAIALQPNDANLHNNLGSLYAEMGKTDEAQAEFQKAAELNPAGAGKMYYNLGVVMYNKGKMDESEAALKKSIEIDPSFPDAYYLEAQALLGKATLGADGKVQPVPGTVEALQKYLELAPNGKFAGAAKQSLDLLQGSVQTSYSKKKKKG